MLGRCPESTVAALRLCVSSARYTQGDAPGYTITALQASEMASKMVSHNNTILNTLPFGGRTINSANA